MPTTVSLAKSRSCAGPPTRSVRLASGSVRRSSRCPTARDRGNSEASGPSAHGGSRGSASASRFVSVSDGAGSTSSNSSPLSPTGTLRETSKRRSPRSHRGRGIPLRCCRPRRILPRSVTRRTERSSRGQAGTRDPRAWAPQRGRTPIIGVLQPPKALLARDLLGESNMTLYEARPLGVELPRLGGRQSATVDI